MNSISRGATPFLTTTAAVPMPRAAIPVNNEADLRDEIMAAENGVPTTIQLAANITLTSVIAIPAGKSITLTGNFSLIQAASTAAVISVEGDAELTIDEITVTHDATAYGRGIAVSPGGRLRMDGGSITGNRVSSFTDGVGVFVNNAEFAMYGGEIYANSGYANGLGVQVSGGGVFDMHGGSIHDNSTGSSGGNGAGVYAYQSVFNMYNGARIYNCNVRTAAGGGGNGGAVYTIANTFNMFGGEIYNCSALYGGGVSSAGVFNMSGGLIHNCTAYGAAGVYNTYAASVFTMTGGEIYDNLAQYDATSLIGADGGGVKNANAIMIMNGGKIYNNIAYNSAGGGVSSSLGGSLTMSGGEIYGNAASVNGGGGGVSGAFTMLGGEIYGNTSANGGGVSSEMFSMEDGYIHDNTAVTSGGGVYINANGEFAMQGGVIGRNGGLLPTTASGNTAVNGGGVFVGTNAAFALSGGWISGNMATANGGGMYVSGGDNVIVLLDGQTEIVGNTANGDGGGVWVPYAYLANIQVGPDVIFADNEASQVYAIDPADIALHNAHVLSRSFSQDLLYGYNNLDIAYTQGEPATVVRGIGGMKTASGLALTAGQFTFGLFNAYDVLSATASNDSAGGFLFPSLALPAGSYDYTVKELTPSGGGWTTDATVFRIHITVTGFPPTTATVSYPDGEPVFFNAFVPPPTSMAIAAYKVLAGWEGPEVPFAFGLYDENGVLVSTAQNVGGVVAFPDIVYTQEGVFLYTIREVMPDAGGWTVDDAVYRVMVTVTLIDEELIAQTDYPDGTPIFVNTFTPARVTLRAGVCCCNRWGLCAPCRPGTHSFGLFTTANGMTFHARTGFYMGRERGHSLLEHRQTGHEKAACNCWQPGLLRAEAVNNCYGRVEFPVEFSGVGLYHFYIRQIDNACQCRRPCTLPVVVCVTENHRGALVARVCWTCGCMMRLRQ